MTTNPFARKVAIASQFKSPIDPAIRKAVHIAIAQNLAGDQMLPDKLTPTTIESNDNSVADLGTLSRLVDDDFPFDESQLAAVTGMSSQCTPA